VANIQSVIKKPSYMSRVLYIVDSNDSSGTTANHSPFTVAGMANAH